MRRALVTGGAGFIGAHLASCLLDRGWEVDLFDNFSRGVEDSDLAGLRSRKGASLIRGDLLGAEGLALTSRDYDCIFHLAAIIGVRDVLRRPYEVLRDNARMLIRMLEYGADCPNLSRFVFSSTSEVYAGTLEYFSLPLPTPEDTPIAVTDLRHPRTSYMLSKIYGEALCHYSGIPLTIVRPHNVYGPRMGLSHVIPELLKKAAETSAEGQIEVYSPKHRRAFCFISDAVEMIVRAAESKSCIGQTLNVGCESPEISIGELAKMVISVVGKGQTIAEGPVTAGSPSRRCPSMRRTSELTGYSAKVGLEEGIRMTYEWYLKHVFQSDGVCAI